MGFGKFHEMSRFDRIATSADWTEVEEALFLEDMSALVYDSNYSGSDSSDQPMSSQLGSDESQSPDNSVYTATDDSQKQELQCALVTATAPKSRADWLVHDEPLEPVDVNCEVAVTLPADMTIPRNQNTSEVVLRNCLTCKNLHRHCDKAKPACGQCRSSGKERECEYPSATIVRGKSTSTSKRKRNTAAVERSKHLIKILQAIYGIKLINADLLCSFAQSQGIHHTISTAQCRLIADCSNQRAPSYIVHLPFDRASPYLLYANKSFFDLLGFTKDNIGMPVVPLIPPRILKLFFYLSYKISDTLGKISSKFWPRKIIITSYAQNAHGKEIPVTGMEEMGHEDTSGLYTFTTLIPRPTISLDSTITASIVTVTKRNTDYKSIIPNDFMDWLREADAKGNLLSTLNQIPLAPLPRMEVSFPALDETSENSITLEA